MGRITLLMFCIIAAAGCRRTATTPAVPPPTPLTPEQIAIKTLPVLARTINQQDLQQLYTFVNNYHAQHGKYPATFQDLGIDSDLPKVAQAIRSKELVYVGGTGPVLAYEAVALDERGSVLTTDGIQVMTADELNKALGR